MKADLTTKLLLALVLAALCALLIRGETTPALAQSQPVPSTGNIAISPIGGTMAYVVSGGRIRFWETDTVNGKPKLVMYDSQPLPTK